MSDKAVITCALTGVLTDPRQHPVPVTPEQMAREAKAAFDAGAAVISASKRRARGICRRGSRTLPQPSCRRSATPARA